MVTYLETKSTTVSRNRRKLFGGDYERSTSKKRIDVGESLMGNYLRKQFQRLECDWMTSRSTIRLGRSESYCAGNESKVSIEGIRPYKNSRSLSIPSPSIDLMIVVSGSGTYSEVDLNGYSEG